MFWWIIVDVTRTDDFVPDSETGTDGVAPDRLDKAILGGISQRVGRFEYRYDTDTWVWSDAVARMHGYEPGVVQPTTDLVLSHKHPDDLARVRALLKPSSAPFGSRHRIRTTTGEERCVVVVGEVVTHEGQVTATRGFYIDVTEAVNADIQRGITTEMDAIVAHRATIDQAKGMMMAIYDINADSAFDLLRWRSQELNIKLHDVAAEIVQRVPKLISEDAPRGAVDHFLMTLRE